jgi:hypothetical protein
MGQPLTELGPAHREFIASQKMFFVATAPLSAGGHVNLSPKGLDSFRVLAPKRVAYIDYTGSGVETIAHIRENGRVTVMFCAFGGRPNILRLYGKGRVIEPVDAEFAELILNFIPEPGVRAIILLDITRVADTCGFGVPLYDYKGERGELVAWSLRKGDGGLSEYKAKKNALSLDGLAGLRSVQQ